MIFYGTIIFILIVIGTVSYHLLKSFARLTRVTITIILLVLTTGMQIGVTWYGLANNQTLEELGKGIIGLIVVIPATVLVAEMIIMPWLSSVINRYNCAKISRKKFIIYVVVSILLNDIVVLWLYS